MSEETKTIASVMKESKPSDQAKAALDAADCQELYKHYTDALQKSDRMAAALSVISEHFIAASDKGPRYAPSENAIEAMERVAIAAIDLAKSVSVAKTTPLNP